MGEIAAGRIGMKVSPTDVKQASQHSKTKERKQLKGKWQNSNLFARCLRNYMYEAPTKVRQVQRLKTGRCSENCSLMQAIGCITQSSHSVEAILCCND